jgi:hypothetical protein
MRASTVTSTLAGRRQLAEDLGCGQLVAVTAARPASSGSPATRPRRRMRVAR